MNNSLEEEEIM
jgi:hypothetical protein